MATVTYADRLQRRLAAMPVQARKRIREALLVSAQAVTDAQRQLAVRSRRSGELINSIGFRDGKHDLQIQVYCGAYYGKFVEFGTHKARAEPFFYPGYRLQRKPTKDRINRAVKKAAKEAASVG